MSKTAGRALFATALVCAGAVLARTADAPRPAAPDVKAGAALAQQYCAACHRVPAPDILPRSAWHNEIEKMSILLEGNTIPSWGERRPKVALSEDYQRILAYYEAQAPTALPPLEPWPAPEAGQFVRRTINFPAALTAEPAVSNVHLVDLDGDGKPELLATDMRQGFLMLAHPGALGDAAPVAPIPTPAHVTPIDLDKDGKLDFLIADLGQFFPGDHEKGAAVWLRNLGGRYEAFRFDGFPRVADVEAGDFDGDGKLDLVVAGFGWRKKGGIWVLLNRTTDWSHPVFERVKVDERPGAIHVIPTDIDGDGKLDFVAVLAQEHEEVTAYLGDGKGGFHSQVLYKAPHPNWGSTGIELVDLNRDGKPDIIMTNGDMFDDDILKPYHGIQWFENKGRLNFVPHPIAHLAGVHRAVAVDVDGDGDLDIVACALTAGVRGDVVATLPSIVWLEQTAPGRFEKHTIEKGAPFHATLDVGDVDGDGAPDVVTGLFSVGGSADHWLEVWENHVPRKPGKSR